MRKRQYNMMYIHNLFFYDFFTIIAPIVAILHLLLFMNKCCTVVPPPSNKGTHTNGHSAYAARFTVQISDSYYNLPRKNMFQSIEATDHVGPDMQLQSLTG